MNARDQAILRAIEKYGVVTAELVELLVEGLPIRRVTQRRLKRLHELGLVKRLRLPSSHGPGPFIYYTGSKPRQITHRLTISTTIAYLTAAGRDVDVRVDATLGTKVGDLVPDATVVLRRGEKFSLFLLEVDAGTEPLRIIHSRACRYRAVLHARAHQTVSEFSRFKGFRVLFITTSDARARNIARTAGEVDQLVFWTSTLDRVVAHNGLTDRIWTVPAHDQAQTILRLDAGVTRSRDKHAGSVEDHGGVRAGQRARARR